MFRFRGIFLCGSQSVSGRIAGECLSPDCVGDLQADGEAPLRVANHIALIAQLGNRSCHDSKGIEPQGVEISPGRIVELRQTREIQWITVRDYNDDSLPSPCQKHAVCV